ncbi:MAG: murein biosynthesis integral membrane protein MurJ, partial [Planctomycetota bacterium]
MISFLTLLSRILGLVRDMCCSHAFGLGGVWSAFALAFQVPNLFRRLFGEGALSAASIPVLTETLTRNGHTAVDALVGRLVGMLLAILVTVCVVAEIVVAGLFLYYRSVDDTALTLTLAGLLLPYLIFICTVAILGGVQNVFGRFALPAAMPIILNVFMITAALGGKWIVPGGHRKEIVLLAAAVIVAGMVQLVWQWFAVRRCGLRMRLSLEVNDPAIRRIAITMLPMVAGLGAVQINTLLDALIAWWFVKEQIDPAGGLERVGPGVLYYAQRLYQFPLGVFAIALATAIFPALSRHSAEDDMPGLGQTLSRGIGVATFEGLPCLVGLILIRKPLVAVLLNRGEFAEWDAGVDRVSLALFMYALGIWAYAVNHLVVRAFYALH